MNTRKQAPGMEGAMARWYAKQRASENQLEQVRQYAASLASTLPERAEILEVAPGPGYLSIELARLGFRVTAVDLSRTFVQIARDGARAAGVEVDVRQGDVTALPCDDEAYDLIVCQAAFKNFPTPELALAEMHRVLRPGGVAIIQDMNGQATRQGIDAEVAAMGLGPVNAVMTRLPLYWLRRRAYTPRDFERMAGSTPFGACEVTTAGIGLDVRLTRAAA